MSKEYSHIRIYYKSSPKLEGKDEDEIMKILRKDTKNNVNVVYQERRKGAVLELFNFYQEITDEVRDRIIVWAGGHVLRHQRITAQMRFDEIIAGLLA